MIVSESLSTHKPPTPLSAKRDQKLHTRLDTLDSAGSVVKLPRVMREGQTSCSGRRAIDAGNATAYMSVGLSPLIQKHKGNKNVQLANTLMR